MDRLDQLIIETDLNNYFPMLFQHNEVVQELTIKSLQQ